MVYKYKLTPLAIDDINEALDYIANYLIEDNRIRHAIVGNYVLFYEVSEREKIIKVLRFLYGKRLISQDIIM